MTENLRVLPVNRYIGQLHANDLTNMLVVVVRYFGGTLLGTGGLINAYRSAAADMLSKASVVTRYVEDEYYGSFFPMKC